MPARATGRARIRAAVPPPSLAGVVPAGAEVQVHPAALELELVDLALAVLLTGGLERQHLQVARQVLKLGQ
jgi:hypothetical protein